jgi:hypothetical protein
MIAVSTRVMFSWVLNYKPRVEIPKESTAKMTQVEKIIWITVKIIIRR